MSDKLTQVSEEQKFVDNFIGNLPKDSTMYHADLHQVRVTAFCEECSKHNEKQVVNHKVTVDAITAEHALLRAALQLEECLEMIRGLGVSVKVHPDFVGENLSAAKANEAFEFFADGQFNLKEIIDGAIDSSVIANGTASMFGVPLQPFTKEVDYNNIAKFKDGHYFREDGKLIKPKNHPNPDMDSVLKELCGVDFSAFTFDWAARRLQEISE